MKKRSRFSAFVIVSFVGSLMFIIISSKASTPTVRLLEATIEKSNFASEDETSPYLPAHEVNPMIFTMDRISRYIFETQIARNKNWCPIPEPLRMFTKPFCYFLKGKNCTHLPCLILHSKKKKHLTCQPIGWDEKKNHFLKPLHCQSSGAFDVFLDNRRSYPSVAINRYQLSKVLFDDTLSLHYRSPRSVWGFQFSDESFRYYPWAADHNLLRLFNLTRGYDNSVYQMLTPAYLPLYVSGLTQQRTSLATVLKDKVEAPSYVKAPILYINANCHSPSRREKFMRKLMKHITVDAWGTCDRNRDEKELPEDIKNFPDGKFQSIYYGANWITTKMAMAKSYLFTVAIENCITRNYVTEKLWQPLVAGSVPLYLGAPNIDDWLPCNNCIIDLRKFSGPGEVAKLLLDLSKNQTRYAEYHRWREEPIPMNFQNRLNYFARLRKHSLECMLCDMMHSRNQSAARARILAELAFDPKKKYD